MKSTKAQKAAKHEAKQSKGIKANASAIKKNAAKAKGKEY